MKVGNITPYSPPEHGPARPASGPKSTGFQQALDNALHSGATTKTPLPGGIQARPLSIARADAVEPGQRTAGIGLMERFIDALEGYRKRLADPQCQLRDIAPALERLEAAHQHLSHFAAEAAVDEPLSAIMNEGLVTAAMEIQRFHGGVYC